MRGHNTSPSEPFLILLTAFSIVLFVFFLKTAPSPDLNHIFQVIQLFMCLDLSIQLLHKA